MANFTQNTLSFYHTFSKTQVNKNAPFNSLGNSINKSGHTVQASDVWADDIPFFAEKGTTGEVHSIFSAHAQTNDLVKVGSKIYQRNATPYSTSETFDTLWSEKTKSIMDWAIVDGEYQYTEVDGALVDGSYLVNAAGKPVIKYYERAQLSILTAANNANVTSNKLASRLKVGGTWGTDSKESVPFMNGGRWVEQFVTVTDKYVNGEAATIYAPQVYLTSTAAAPQVAGTVYFDFCATGVILWDSRTADGKEVITCFEYVGDKLSNALTNISSEIEDIVSTTMEGVVASVGTTNAASTAGLSIKGTKTAPTVDITTGSVTTGETKLVTGGAVAAVTDALAGRIAQLEGIQHFSVAVVDALPETPVENTIYLVPEEGKTSGNYVEYIAYKPAGSETVTTERIGTTAIDLSGYTTDGEHEALQGRVSTIETTTVPALEQAIAGAKTEASTNLATARTEITAEIAQAKSEAIASAEVTITAGTGIVVTGEGKGTTFQIAVSDEVATAASVSALSQVVASNKTELEGKITAAETAASTALETAKTEIKGTTDALDTRLQTAEGKVSTLEGQVATLTTGDNSVAKQIETAANTIKGQTLAQTGTLSGMFSVTTAGSVGTGITGITISDTGLSAAITKAKTDAETTAATALSTARGEITTEIGTAVSGLETKLTTGEGSLGAKVAALETATGTTLPAAIEQALTDAKAYSDSLHTTSLDYVVLGDSETLPTASAETLGKIYLVKEGNTANGETGIDAISGSYVEYMTRKVGEGETATYTWEKIGTTAADLSGYTKSVTINGRTYTATAANAGALDLGNVVVGTYNSMADGVTYASEQPNRDSIYVGIHENGYIGIGVASATDSVMGVSKMFTGNLSTAVSEVVDTAVSVKSAQAMYSSLATLAGGKLAQIYGGDYLTLSALAVHNGNTVSPKCIDPTTDKLPKNIISVIGNMMFADNGAIFPIEPEKIYNDNISFNHFAEGSNLVTWCADLPGVESGSYMFASSNALTSFSGDLSNLRNGYSMFGLCYELTSFCGDLSSLEVGDNMFDATNLNLESVECIADTINEYEGEITIRWKELPAEEKRQELVDELSRIVDKGWTLKTNQELLPLFDGEKYQTGTYDVQPKTRDANSETVTVYYVRKK